MTPARRLAFSFALLSALLLASAACGGGDDDDDSGDDAEGTATREAEDDEDETSEADDEDGGNTDGETNENEIVGIGPNGEVACELLTDEEVEAAFPGQDLDDTVATGIAPFFGCRWETGNFDAVTVDIFPGDEEELQVYFDLSEETSEPVEGLAGPAHWDDDFATLEALVPNYDVSISVLNFDSEDEENKQIAIDLMDKVLGRLQ